MERYSLEQKADGSCVVRVPHRGARLLMHPMYNKSTAFGADERRRLGLEGLLPAVESTMAQQARRAYGHIVRKTDALERYVGLAALQDRNEHLFFRVLVDHLEELLPIVYTPTVGEACRRFSEVFRRPRGIWVTPAHRGRIDEVLANAPWEDVRLIVVTDNERILGLGDLGAGGMGIPIGKLALYTAAAGIHPAVTLPVSLDVGTDNAALRDDDLYVGWRAPRLRGADYDALVEEFVQAVRRRWPKALLQWEDFKKGNAIALLDRYRSVLPSFNDDIQGTAAVAVAAMVAATRVTRVPVAEQRAVILGAGAAGLGIARLIRETLARAGVTGEALVRAVANLDSHGLLVDDGNVREAYKRELAWPAALAAAHGLGAGRPSDLAAVVGALRPTVLVGTSGQPGTFTEDVVRTMAQHVERPVILPLSNPTDLSEGKPADILRWTNGRALVATGSPFGPVRFGERTFVIGQANNAFVFPGIGLGVLVSEAGGVTEAMFAAAAACLAAAVSDEELAAGSLFPAVRRLRAVTAQVAEAVVHAAQEAGTARPLAAADVPEAVARAMWEPQYPDVEPAGH